MKKVFEGFKKGIVSIFIGLAVIGFCNYVAMALHGASGYMPYTWTLTGKTVSDSSYYGGKYYQIRDDFRVVLIQDKQFNEFHEYVVFENNGEKYVKTGGWTFASTHSTKIGMIWYLKSTYLKWKAEKKRNKGYL